MRCQQPPVQRLHALRRINLPRLDQPQPHGGRQAVVVLLRWAADLHLAIPQFHHRRAFGPSRIACRQFDCAPPGHRKRCRGGKQRAAVSQQAVLHRAAQQMEVCRRHRRPIGIDVGFAVGHHCHHFGRSQHLLRLLRGVPPMDRLPLRQRTLVMWDRIDSITAPDIAARQACPRAGQCLPLRRRGAGPVGRGTIRSRHPLRSSRVPARRMHCPSSPDQGRGDAGRWLGTSPRCDLGSPERAARCRPPRFGQPSPQPASQPSPPPSQGQAFRIGKQPPGLQLTPAVTAQPAQAHRFAQHHLFESLPSGLTRGIAAPLYRGADLRMTQGTFPWRLLCSVSRVTPNRTRAASHKG